MSPIKACGSSSVSVARSFIFAVIDDEERLSIFLPDWQKNSQLLLLKNKDGKASSMI